MTNVLIVEDSRVSRELFERQLEAAGFHVIAAIENAANAETTSGSTAKKRIDSARSARKAKMESRKATCAITWA